MKTKNVKVADDEILPTPITFAAVAQAVEDAVGLTEGVRSNLRSAVVRCADLMGSQGMSVAIDLQLIARRFDRLTAAKIGFKTDNALSAFRSNLRRALRMGGIKVMPGRARTPLSPVWRLLAGRLKAVTPYRYPPLSRFLHHLSAHEVEPGAVNADTFSEFGNALRTTNLNSKTEKVLRNAAKAWAAAKIEVTGWPQGDLGYERQRVDCPLLPWTEFPPSLEADARDFVTRGDIDWDAEEDQKLKPLAPRTQLNYLDAIRRIASILVKLDVNAGSIATLRDLVSPDRAQAVLREVKRRTGRSEGGHVQLLAVLLLMIAERHVKVSAADVAKLTAYRKRCTQHCGKMSPRTHQRLIQFEDEDRMQAILNLPRQLMALAEKSVVREKKVTTRAAKLARVALFLAILMDTSLRQGNVVGIDLNRHLITEGTGRKRRVWVIISKVEVKNRQDIRAELSPYTVAMFGRFIERYRPFHCVTSTTWLFPRQDGSHLTTTSACQDLLDLAGRHAGVDITPHVIRSLTGKIVLDAHPGALGTVQQLLGHHRIATTQAFYTAINEDRTRASYRELLVTRRRRG